MLGLFGTLDLGARSLQNQLTAIEVTGHNLANVNNPAYARQRVRLQTNNAIPTPLGPQGTGAHAAMIEQLRNALLDRQLVNESSVTGYWQTQQHLLEQAESSLGQALDRQASAATGANSVSSAGNQMGLAENLSAFFTALQAVATQPASIAERQVLMDKAQALADQLNQVMSRLDSLRQNINQSLQTETDAVNRLTAEIAELNRQIAKSELSARGPANDLRDLRQQKLEELGKYVNFDSVEDASGQVQVSLNGLSLVNGQQVENQLEAYDPGQGALLLRTAAGQPVTPLTGSLAGLLDVRDGPLDTLAERLDTLAGRLITECNAAHASGFGLEGGTGRNFFLGTDAATIRLNSALAEAPSLFQAAGSADEPGDNSVVLALARLASRPQAALGGQTFQQFFHQSVVGLGESLAHANRQVSDQDAISRMLLRQRDAVSGVSLDEEMTEMVKFQKAFQASARLITTVDEMLDIVIGMKR